MGKIIRLFFYGNVYLGISAVALCIETNLLIGVSLNKLPFYLLIFLCTCLYYTTIYIRSIRARSYNERTIWYRKNLKTIKNVCRLIATLAFVFLLALIFRNRLNLLSLTSLQTVLIIAFPVVAGWYTFSLPFFGLKKIRQTGWLKPFIIGLTWMGWVTVYPLLIRDIQTPMIFQLHFTPVLLLCFQNFLFFSINAIIFDIKDHHIDVRHRLNTLPVIFGVSNTFRFIVIPGIALNLAVFFMLQWQQNFSPVQTALQLIPYLLLIFAVATYRESRSVLYYLVAVDGLVFVKAVCGITSILFLKN